jgi:hypothetical protein
MNMEQQQEATAAEFEEFKRWKDAQSAAAEADRPREYYVHLADGNTVVLGQEALDSAGSHYEGIQIIATYTVGD